jgi:hypothetical protein
MRSTLVTLAFYLGVGALGCSDHSSHETPDDAGHHDASKADASRSDGGTGADGAVTDAGGGADARCEDAAVNFPDGCALGPMCEPLDLSCTGLYSDWASKTISPKMHEYDPGLHLWSDGADKTRWISLPEGKPIDTSDMDEWTFPVNTKLFKQFVLEGQLIETRMLWKLGDVAGWYATTYHWSADQTKAPELTTGFVNADGHGFDIPDQTDCYSCHYGRLDDVLGFEAVALSTPNAALALTTPALAPLTLGGLVDAGWITKAPPAPLVIPGGPTASAALGYLHINCGVPCHNSGSGEAQVTGFLMRLDVATLGSVAATDTVTTGVNQTSGFAIPDEPKSYLLDPGNVPESAVAYRMSVRDGVDDAGTNAQMPPIATNKVDDAGLAIVTKWIEAGCGD